MNLKSSFENLPVLLLLIKLAAFGNLKVNFHCAHWHRFFPLKKGLSKTHQSSLTLKGGSTAFPKPLFSWRRLAALGNMKANFHCAHLHNLSPQGTGDVPTALSIVFTTPSVPLVGDRNVALNHFILWLADHQRSTPAAKLRFFVRG